MVKTYIGYHTQHRCDDVRAVQTTSETCFKNDDIHILGREPVQGQKSGDLEEGHVQMVEGVAPLMNEGPDIFLGDEMEGRSFASLRMTSDHPHAFTEIENMG